MLDNAIVLSRINRRYKMIKNRQVKVDYEFSLFSLLRSGASIIIILILAYFLFQARGQLTEQANLNTALKDSVQTWRGKDGLNRAKIETLETSKSDEFLALASKDDAIVALQNEVRSMKRYLKKKGSVTNFTSETSVDTSVPTEVVDNGTPFPTYKSKFDLNGWVYGNSVATKDSTYYNLKVKNKYSLTLGVEPTGFLGLGKGKPFAQVKNLNPYSETQELKTYQVSSPKPKRWGVGPVAAYGLNLGPVPQLGGFIGVGAQYSLIRF